MRNILISLLHSLSAAVQSRLALHLEILALRQQLAVLNHTQPRRPHLRPFDRFFWVCLSKLWPGWRNPLIIVKAATVVAWSRKGFRLFWTWKSRRGRSGRPAVPKDVRDLIRKPPSQTWRTFLANHVHNLVSVHFFTVPTVTFRVFFVFIVLAHDRRRVTHFNNHRSPVAS